MSLQSMLNHLLVSPGDNESDLELKRNFFIFTFSVIPPVITLTVVTYLVNVPVLFTYGLWLIPIYLCSTIGILLVKKHVTAFFYFIAVTEMSLTIYTITKQGGLFYSGGIEYSMLAIVVFAFIFYSKSLVTLTSILYMAGILFLALFNGHWKVAPEMVRGNVNLIFTTINSMWISVYILFIIIYIFNKRTKEEKDKIEKLREMDELKSRFFTNITHEFRTPLTLITGAAQTSTSTHLQLSHEKRYEIITHNARRLLRLVNQMLGLARIESGLIDLHFVQADMMNYLAYLLDSTRSMADKKQVKLHFIKKEDEVLMDIDKDKWEDIVLNLLYNAIKFTPPGGNVYLMAQRKDHDSLFEMEIKDTGIGISEDKIPFIFDRFYQATDQASAEGSGIGLTLVKEYLKVLGGTIDVKSKIGKGCSFTVSLPIHQTAALAPIQEYFGRDIESPQSNVEEETWLNAESPQNPQAPHILVVEDNAELAHFLKAILSFGYQIDIATNGEEGINQAIALVPDLIICDVMMPIKDGYELCTTLKNDFRTNHIPIILLTARADSDAKISGLQKGADAYIYKPFNEKELLVRIEKLIELREKLKIKYSSSPFHKPESSDFQHPHGLNERFMYELVQILDTQYRDENFGIQQLCEKMLISRVQLHRKLTALTGLSASHFINKFRAEKGSVLLLNSRKSISEIAFEVGFSDPAYFSRVFNKLYGKSPMEFRGQKQ